MMKAFGFACMVIVFLLFFPDVLHALQTFVLVLLGKATQVLQAIPVSAQ